MQISLFLLFYQCAILSVSFEGIVCVEEFDFVIDNFCTADIYNRVRFLGDKRNGEFIFEKGPRGRRHVVKVPEILHSSLRQEENCPKIASFTISGSMANYNIKFHTGEQANLFVRNKVLPKFFKIRWGRIYSNWRPALMGYDVLDNGDIGFKLIDNDGNYPDIDDRLEKMSYLFTRFQIKRQMRISDGQTLYLRNIVNLEDYAITFQSTDNLDTFLEFFPERQYDGFGTQNYYIIPPSEEPHGTSESGDTAESHDLSESHDLQSKSHDLPESCDKSE